MQISSRGEETPSESADGEAIEVLGSDGPQQANEDGDHVAGRVWSFRALFHASAITTSQRRNGGGIDS
ncbi:MAG: hypothetical protein QOE74_904, partial [Mycobacterium sp.]|nr:hypothetical protein [Mycobacterium sp.]